MAPAASVISRYKRHPQKHSSAYSDTLARIEQTVEHAVEAVEQLSNSMRVLQALVTESLYLGELLLEVLDQRENPDPPPTGI